MHVLIIGGGIGGLCLAQGLRRRGVSVAVYERDRTPDARLQGYRLSIEPPGSAALHDCLPPELWQILVATSGDQGERMGVFDEQLRQLMEEDAKPDRADPASGSHAISPAGTRCCAGSWPSPTRTPSSSSTSPPRPRSNPGRTPA